MAVLENTRHDSFAVSINYLGVSIGRDQLVDFGTRSVSVQNHGVSLENIDPASMVFFDKLIVPLACPQRGFYRHA